MTLPCVSSAPSILLLLLVPCYAPPHTGQYAAAYAELKLLPVGGSAVTGKLVVMQVAGKHGFLYMTGEVTGLGAGEYMAEVHRQGDC